MTKSTVVQKEHRVVGALAPQKVIHEAHLNVRRPHGGLMNAVVITSDAPLGDVREGERITIGDLEGFPEARQTVGRVKKIAHTFTGDSQTFRHVVMVDIDEVDV